MAFAQIEKHKTESFVPFPLIPNVAFAQSDKSGNPSSAPSDSFSLTVTASTSCPGLAPVPPGTNGDDTIYGTDNGETINGLNGQDHLFGCGGNDILNGGNGVDTLDGGSGDDTLVGGNAADTLTGGPGADTFDCGHGPDTVTDFNPTEGDTLVACENATIADTTPPVVTVPANIQKEATSSAGAVVTFTATANDAVDGPITPTCAPAIWQYLPTRYNYCNLFSY